VLPRRLAAWSLIVGPLTAVAGTALHPAREPDESEHLASVAANLDRWYAAHALFVVGLALAVPSILALVRLAGARQPRLAQVGGTLAFVGLIAVAPVIGWEFVIWEMAKPEHDPAAMTALLEGMNESPGLLVLGVASVALPLGFVALAVALRRAGEVPAWQAVALGAGYVVFFVGGLATTTAWVPLAGALAILAGSAPIGWRLLAAPAQARALAPT
jgi:hypothetical protein